MNTLFAGLQSLIITVRRNFLSSAFTTVMLLLLIFTWSARDNIATFIERNPSAHQEKQRFDQAIVVDSQVGEALSEIRSQLNADRIVIRQFHNSKTDLTGLPFTSVSTTYYSLAPGVGLTSESLQSFPVSTINEQLRMMFVPNEEPRCSVIRPQGDIRDPTYSKNLRDNGVAIAFSCPLMNLRGQPVGFIAAAYLTQEKPKPDDDKIMLILNNTGQRVVGYLSNVVAVERKPWYATIFGS